MRFGVCKGGGKGISDWGKEEGIESEGDFFMFLFSFFFWKKKRSGGGLRGYVC